MKRYVKTRFELNHKIEAGKVYELKDYENSCGMETGYIDVDGDYDDFIIISGETCCLLYRDGQQGEWEWCDEDGGALEPVPSVNV